MKKKKNTPTYWWLRGHEKVTINILVWDEICTTKTRQNKEKQFSTLNIGKYICD